jgi:hypothetical protein
MKISIHDDTVHAVALKENKKVDNKYMMIKDNKKTRTACSVLAKVIKKT